MLKLMPCLMSQLRHLGQLGILGPALSDSCCSQWEAGVGQTFLPSVVNILLDMCEAAGEP